MSRAQPPPYELYATACLEALQQNWYDEWTGLWKSANWWNTAQAVEAIIDYASYGHRLWVGDKQPYRELIAKTFATTRTPNEKNNEVKFYSEYYDDQLWFASAWIKAYDFTKEAHYLYMAEDIFRDTTYAEDQICGGGVWWRRYHEGGYKNAITNELFLLVAARLYLRTEDTFYLEKLLRVWSWFLDSGLISDQYLIYDRLAQGHCDIGDRTIWTYNQGVILSALVELFHISCLHGFAYGEGNVLFLAFAQNIADAVLRILVTQGGILTEPYSIARDDKDAPQFKGIFIRHLSYFAMAYENADRSYPPERRYRQFIQRNADMLWQHRSPRNTFGAQWEEPVDTEDAVRQIAALDLFNSAAPYGRPPAHIGILWHLMKEEKEQVEPVPQPLYAAEKQIVSLRQAIAGLARS